MNTEAMRAVLAQSFGVSGFGVIIIAILVVFVIPFVIAKPPTEVSEREHWSQQAYQKSSNFLWWVIFIAAVIFAAALVGEVGGVDSIPGMGPR